MKLSKTGLIIGMVTTGALSAGTAFALVSNTDASKTADPASYDQAIYLYWGKDSTTASIGDVTGLVVGTSQYRYLSVTPKSTSQVEGTVTVSFALTTNEGCFSDGLTIKVYKIDAIEGEVTETKIATNIGTKSASAQVNGNLHTGDEITTEAKLTDSVSFDVSDRSADLYSYNYYGLEFSYDGYLVENETLGAKLTITQTFAESTNE